MRRNFHLSPWQSINGVGKCGQTRALIYHLIQEAKTRGRKDREKGPGGNGDMEIPGEMGTWRRDQGEWGQGKFNLPPPHADDGTFL